MYIVDYSVQHETVKPTPPSKTYHIIWNLLLADKQLELTQDTIDSEKICHIMAILPHTADFLQLNTQIKDVPFTVLEYGDMHTPSIDKDLFKGCGEMIDSIAKKEGRRNVLVFCNNGYQRSIPFLVYYLTTFHNNEVPTIEKALSIILSQVDKANYNELMKSMIPIVRQLLS